jgi:hypothetical protein
LWIGLGPDARADARICINSADRPAQLEEGLREKDLETGGFRVGDEVKRMLSIQGGTCGIAGIADCRLNQSIRNQQSKTNSLFVQIRFFAVHADVETLHFVVRIRAQR